MRELNAWLASQRRRERRVVYLEDALLSDRFWAYAVYRLRFFFARYVAESVTHALVVILAFRSLSEAEFVAVVAVYAAGALVSNFWWGALEAMRGRIRSFYRFGRARAAPGEIARWLSLSIQLGVVAAAAALVVGALGVAGGDLGPARLLVVVLLLRLALDLPVRCYHSGVYAIRRIYRPLWAIVALEATSTAVLLGLWPWLGAWSLSAAAASSALLATALSVHYCRRTYRFLGLEPGRLVALLRFRLPPRGSGRELFAGGAAFAAMSLDSPILLTLLVTGRGSLDDTALFALFFAAGPTIQAGFEWARLLYFDLKRLELRLFRNVRRRFHDHAVRLALVLGVVFWGLASAIGTALYGRALGATLYGLLLLFFVSRCLLAVAQVEAFAEGAYGELLRNAALVLGGFLAAAALMEEQAALLGALGVVGLAAFALLLLRADSGRQGVRTRGEVLWVSEWLAQVGRLREEVRICAVDLVSEDGDEEERWRQRQLAAEVARGLDGSGAVALVSPRRVIWYEQAGSAPAFAARVIPHSGGLGRLVGEPVVGADGAAAVELALARGLLGSGPATVPGCAGTEWVRAAFLARFPRAIVYSPAEPIDRRLAELSSTERRLVMLDAVAFAREFRSPRERSRFDVTAFCEAGELRLIFLIDRHAGRRVRARWRSFARTLNVQAALVPERG